VGEIPFVTGIFPLGTQLGMDTKVTAHGWNLKDAGLALNTSASGGDRGYRHHPE